MSTVTITATRDAVTVKGCAGGTVTIPLEGGTWTGALVDETGAVRLQVDARDHLEPTVAHYTENGHESFPADWTFTDTEPGKTTIKTVGAAHLAE